MRGESKNVLIKIQGGAALLARFGKSLKTALRDAFPEIELKKGMPKNIKQRK